MKCVIFLFLYVLFFSCNNPKNDLIKNKNTSQANHYSQTISFEPEENLTDNGTLSEGESKTGKWACQLDNNKEFSIIFSKKVFELKQENILLNRVSASAWFFPSNKNPDAHIVFVIKNKNDSTISWQSKSTQKDFFPINNWTKLNAAFKIENELNNDDELVLYIWNKGKSNIRADDFSFSFGEYVISGNELPMATINYLTDSITYADNIKILKNRDFYFVKDFSEIPFSLNTQFYVGNFCGNKTSELLTINNDTLYLWQYCTDNLLFKLICNEPLSFFTKNKKNIQLINSSTYTLLQVENICYSVSQKNTDCSNTNAKWEKTENTPVQKIDFFSFVKSAKFSIPFYKTNDTLSFNKTTRPEVFLISEKGKRKIIFNNYPENQNPLFYEMQLILPFYIENQKEHLLSIVANCIDENFTVNNCSKFENKPAMQNTVLLFIEK